MKILMLLEGRFPPDVRVENEMAALTSAGFEMHIASYLQPGQQREEHTPLGIIHRKRIPPLIYKSSVGALKFPFYFRFWKEYVQELFDREHFDAIHVHDLPLARIGWRFSRRYHIPFVLDLHEIWPALLRVSAHTQTWLGRLLSSDSQWRAYERLMVNRADRVIAVVDESRDRLIRMGVDPERVCVVSNTLVLSTFQIPDNARQQPGSPFRLLYVGGVNYHRGLQYVLKAIACLKQQHIPVRFDLVGDGSYLAALRRQIAELRIQQEVVVHGFRKYTEITDLYASADAALIPHVKSEHTDHTVPHKIFQYLYAGTPVLVSNCDPLVRIVRETGGGMSYTYDDPEDLAEKIMQLTRPEVWRRYAYAGRTAVEQRYNWEHDGARLADLYGCLLA